MDKLIEAGKIINTHGIHGEVKIESWLDSPEFLKSFKVIYINGAELNVVSATVHKGFVISKMDGIDSIEKAEALKGKTVFIDRADAKLPKGRFFIDDIMGFRAETESGEFIGTLEEVIELPSSLVYIIKDGETEHYVPAVPEFIMSTNLNEKFITVRLIEGM